MTQTVKERHHERRHLEARQTTARTQPYNDLFSALETGVILGGTATSFSMKDGPAVVIFHGSFTVINGTITAGTISSFQVFHNSAANKLMDVSGYSANFQAFKQAVTQYNQGDGSPDRPPAAQSSA